MGAVTILIPIAETTLARTPKKTFPPVSPITTQAMYMEKTITTGKEK